MYLIRLDPHLTGLAWKKMNQFYAPSIRKEDMVIGVKFDGFRVVLNSFFEVILSERLVPPPFQQIKRSKLLAAVTWARWGKTCPTYSLWSSADTSTILSWSNSTTHSSLLTNKDIDYSETRGCLIGYPKAFGCWLLIIRLRLQVGVSAVLASAAPGNDSLRHLFRSIEWVAGCRRQAARRNGGKSRRTPKLLYECFLRLRVNH